MPLLYVQFVYLTVQCSTQINNCPVTCPSAKEIYAHMREITKPGGEFVVRNFVGVIEDIGVEASLV
jgi:hypothetical protein